MTCWALIDCAGRYYHNVTGRFLTPDPYKGSADPWNPQSWNRYTYGLNDPELNGDPTGLDGNSGSTGGSTGPTPYYTGAVFTATGTATADGVAEQNLVAAAFDDPGDAYAISGTAQIVSGPRERIGAAPFAPARQAFERAAKAIAAKNKFKQPCNDDFTALKTNAAAVQAGASNALFLNGVGSSVTMASLYSTSPVPGVVQAGSTLTGTVSDFIAANPGTVAVAQLGGADIYLNAALIDPANYYQDIAVVLHEVLHNVTGLTDTDIQRALGLKGTSVSNNITQKLLKDCF